MEVLSSSDAGTIHEQEMVDLVEITLPTSRKHEIFMSLHRNSPSYATELGDTSLKNERKLQQIF